MSAPPDDHTVALAYLAALGGDDPATVWSLVADDFRNQHHAVLGAGCTGREEYASRLPGFFDTFGNRSYDVLRTVVGHPLIDGELDTGTTEVVVDYRFRAEVEGTPIDIPGTMWITVRNGEIRHRLDCWDSVVYHRQTGTSPDLG